MAHGGTGELVWERAEPVTPAGRPDARAADIAQAAFDIADREGLEAVSVKRVATRLKVQAAALSGYLHCREDLLDLMLDRAFGDVDLPAQSGNWRADLRAIALATQQVALRHPWLRMLAGTRTPSGPNGLRVNEHILAALDGTGLTPVQTTQLANAVLAFVYGFVQLDMRRPRRGRDEQLEAAHRERTSSYLQEKVGSGRYPHLAQLFAEADGLTAEAAFDAGLEVVLDGVAGQIARAQQAVEQPAIEQLAEAAFAEPEPVDATSPVRIFGRLRRARSAPKTA